jgi:hypothetical protein
MNPSSTIEPVAAPARVTGIADSKRASSTEAKKIERDFIG